MNTYYDQYGRLHDKYVTDTNPYPCNNSFLYSGEASVLGLIEDKNKVKILTCYTKCSTHYGFNRNPDGKQLPASSHDEIVGLFMLLSDTDAIKYLYEDTEEQYFQVCNLPDFKPTKWYKLNPFKVVRDFWRLSREENPRKATYKYPYIAPIVFRHAPQHTYFYARCAGRKTGIIHSLYFFISSLTTIFGNGNSGKVMLGFKLLKLKQLGETQTEQLVRIIYNMRVDFWLEVDWYFNDDHPISQKVQELRMRYI